MCSNPGRRNGEVMEVRRSARVAAEFYVTLAGVEREPVLRRGNISATGIYFVTDANVGDVGMMSWLDIKSVDGERSLHVMAYVVRHVTLNDIEGPPIVGVALEFMTEGAAAALAVQDFVRYVLSLRRGETETRPDMNTEVEPEPPPSSGSGAPRMSIKSMVLETTWPVSMGEDLVLDVQAVNTPCSVRMKARALRVVEKRDPRRYLVHLEGQGEADQPPRPASSAVEEMVPAQPVPLSIRAMDDDEVSQTVDDLLSALTVQQQPSAPITRSRRFHLSGTLSRIPITTLCSLFEMERLTGKLVVRDGDEATTIYLRDGRLVDVEPLSENTAPLERLRGTLGLQKGSFEFFVQPVDRADRVGVSTTALLLEFARLSDEAAHGITSLGA